MTSVHVPVLQQEILAVLSPQSGETVLDCTLGLGGHASAFLRATAPEGRLIGLDADATNLRRAQESLQPFGARVVLHRMNFRDVPSVVTHPVDIVFADLGLSSPHLDDPARGFSFRASGPLDLRYDQSSGPSAAEFLLSSSVEEITRIFREFGEIQRSHQLATALHAHFHTSSCGSEDPRLVKTDDVVHCVEQVFTYRAPKVLPQVFQALRIAVNDELGALRSLLASLPDLLNPGGCAGIISYHSLDDRLVKETFRSLAALPKDDVTGQDIGEPQWQLLTRRPVMPSAGEIAANPRSRSARLRVIRRLPLSSLSSRNG